MLDDVIRCLVCPYCGDALWRSGGSLRCGTGHTFDIARQGYVSLLPAGARAGAGDTAAMVAARASFLAAGWFAPLAQEIGELAAGLGEAATGPDGAAAGLGEASAGPDGAAAGLGEAAARPGADEAGAGGDPGAVPGCVAEMGAGTGYFLVAVLNRLPGRAGLALDISKFALRKAARAHPRIGAVGCDTWRRLPVADGAVAIALSVFAPRNGPELHRILHPRGRLIVVTPQPGHLAELAGPLGLLSVDPDKDRRLAGKLAGHFDVTARRSHVRRLTLGRAQAGALAAMGPSAWHIDAGTLAERLERLPDPVQVTLAVTLSVYAVRAAAGRPRGPGPGVPAAPAASGAQPIDLTTASSSPANEAR